PAQRLAILQHPAPGRTVRDSVLPPAVAGSEAPAGIARESLLVAPGDAPRRPDLDRRAELQSGRLPDHARERRHSGRARGSLVLLVRRPAASLAARAGQRSVLQGDARPWAARRALTRRTRTAASTTGRSRTRNPTSTSARSSGSSAFSWRRRSPFTWRCTACSSASPGTKPRTTQWSAR